MEADGWDVLADDVATYAATRLSGVPLRQVNSRIDYIMVSDCIRGLRGEEVVAATAQIHTECIGGSADEFRRHASDHLPVTVEVAVVADTDGN